MKASDIAAALLSEINELEVIDSHEHLVPEEKRLQTEVDVFILFSKYTRGDLQLAGLRDPDSILFNHEIPLERRWEIFDPYWRQIRWGSYARAALLAAEKIYGFEDVNESTYRQLSEAIKKANKPGLYERVLRDACRIRLVLTQSGTTDLGSPLLRPVMSLVHEMETWASLSRPVFASDANIRSLDDYLDGCRSYIDRVRSEGAVGLKMISNPYGSPNRREAVDAFEDLRRGRTERLPDANPLRDYIVDQMISFAAERDLTVAVHTGYWGDFRNLDPLHMIPILQKHPEARFDIYHLGYPWVRETLMLGKGFPNVWLNFCWTHIISQSFAASALVEAIDLVPMSKIIAFGGDYILPVEKVYGHLAMARENVARALAERIERRQMTEDQALKIARQWFWDNPRDLYRLDI